MNNNQRHSVELKLICAKNALRFVKQLDAVKEADKAIDEAIVELFAESRVVHSDEELLFDESPAGISKRLAQLELMIKKLTPSTPIGGPR